jgi:flagellar biosynthesis GTPase FlhF
MQVRVFTAPRLHEALALVRRELGPDAVILDRQRKVNGNSETLWQVHAALDATPETADDPRAACADTEERRRLEDSMKRLERLISGLSRQEADALRACLPDDGARRAFDQLVRLGVNPDLATDMAADFAERAPVAERMLTWAEKPRPGRKREVILLTGPAGGGKTLLAAKLATWYSLRGVPVAFATTDTERMGGMETLNAYAEVLGVPLAPLRREEQAPEIARQLELARLVLVDSEGWSPGCRASLKRQRPLWDALKPDRRWLVMPATMDESDGMRLMDAATDLNAAELAFTKVDETCMIGKLVNWAGASGMALSCCGYGQDAAEGVGLLTPRALTSLLASHVTQGGLA